MSAITNYGENLFLNWMFRGLGSAPSGIYVKLHTGDPGEDATANAASNTTRVQATFGSSATTGTISNTAQIQWTSVSATETYSHVSLWDASTAGNPLWKGALTSSVSVTSGGTFTIATGDLDVALD
jgi:hypothetical protein